MATNVLRGRAGQARPSPVAARAESADGWIEPAPVFAREGREFRGSESSGARKAERLESAVAFPTPKVGTHGFCRSSK